MEVDNRCRGGDQSRNFIVSNIRVDIFSSTGSGVPFTYNVSPGLSVTNSGDTQQLV